MRACIHRGSEQIGGSCVEVESGGRRLLIDLGLPLDATGHPAQYVPPVAGLDGSDPSLLGVFVSHPHLDHYGLLNQIAPEIPVGMGPAARRILAAAAPFMPWQPYTPSQGPDYVSGQPIEISPFRITPLLMDHSAYDAYALQIEADGRCLFYSGDLRAHGRKAALFERLLSHPPDRVDALLLEGSSIGRIADDEPFPSETDIEDSLVQILRSTDGLALVHASGQNIDRIVSILRACGRTGRTMVIDLYVAAILEATGNPRIPQSHWDHVALYVPESQRRQVVHGGWYALLRRHASHRIYPEHLQAAPRRFCLLFRPMHCADLERAGCLEGAAFVYSMWQGYWERGSYASLEPWLERNAVQKIDLHTSGHASPGDLQRLVAALRPARVVPIHTFSSGRYPELFPRVERHADGEWWEV